MSHAPIGGHAVLFGTLIAIVLLFMVPALFLGAPYGEHMTWSAIAAAFPLSLVTLILINLKGTLRRRLVGILEQIQSFEGSLRAKLEDESGTPEHRRDDDYVRNLRSLQANLDRLDQQRRALNSKYQPERFHGSVAFLAAVYSFGFFFVFNKITPVGDFGGLQEVLEKLPNAAVAAMFGAWAFALFSVIARISTADQSPQFLLRLSFQPVITIGIAFFATFMFNTDFTLLISFGIGFLPYSELVGWLRRVTTKQMSSASDAATVAGAAGDGGLSEIDGIGFDEIDRLHEENIKNIQQLAFSDPLETHFSTAYPLKTVIDWADQATLRIYLSQEVAKKLRPIGIRGAIEMAQVRRRVREFEARSKKATTAGDTAKAQALAQDIAVLLQTVAAATGTNEIAVRNLAYQLGEDPHIEFIYFLYDELASSA